MIKKIGMFPLVQKIVKKTENKKFYDKLNRTLPSVESLFATGCYAVAIQKNKTIEEERKPSMQWQNGICGIVGISIGSRLNKFIEKHKQAICEELEHRNVVKVNNVIKGVQIAVPLIITSAIMRFIVPVLATGISTKIVKKIRELRGSKE